VGRAAISAEELRRLCGLEARPSPDCRPGAVGRPLFTEKLPEQTPYLRSQYLIASNYAPAYGLLANGGKSLFIVDAVNRCNYFFHLANDTKSCTIM
jgi:hypothetical protein